MKHIKKSFIIMGIITLLGGILGCKAQSAKFQSMTVNDFEKCIADTSVVRLDVRTVEEYADGHISKALNIDVLKSDFKS